MNYRYRILYEKGENLRYTSNLDIHRVWERSFRRSGLPLAYSQGFNPQPKIQQASPLPLGFLSEAEFVDFYLCQEFPMDEMLNLLNNSLPAGIKIIDLKPIPLNAPPLQTLTLSSLYHVYFLDEIDTNWLNAAMITLLDKKSIPRLRRGKSYDLRPLIFNLELSDSDHPYLIMELSTREDATGRPEEVLKELNIPFENTRIIRKQIIFNNHQ